MLKLHGQSCTLCNEPILLLSEEQYDIKSVHKQDFNESVSGIQILIELEPHKCEKV